MATKKPAAKAPQKKKPAAKAPQKKKPAAKAPEKKVNAEDVDAAQNAADEEQEETQAPKNEIC